jgi:hypothetical protein
MILRTGNRTIRHYPNRTTHPSTEPKLCRHGFHTEPDIITRSFTDRATGKLVYYRTTVPGSGQWPDPG